MNDASPHQQNIGRGIVLMLIAVGLFVVMDTTAKYLSQSYSVLEVMWARYLFHALTLVVFLRKRLIFTLRTERPLLQLLRSTTLLAGTGFFVFGISFIPLADASAIFFLAPILVTALSMPLLGERVGLRRWIGVLIGFIGAAIVIRPGTGMMNVGSLLILAAAFVYAIYMITTRVLNRTDSALTTTVYSSVVGTVACCIAAPFVWVMPDAKSWALMVMLGILGAISHYILILSFRYAPAAVVSPFDYSRLIWSVLFGVIIFGDIPDVWTIVGSLVIAASGLYILHREQKVGSD